MSPPDPWCARPTTPTGRRRRPGWWPRPDQCHPAPGGPARRVRHGPALPPPSRVEWSHRRAGPPPAALGWPERSPAWPAARAPSGTVKHVIVGQRWVASPGPHLPTRAHADSMKLKTPLLAFLLSLPLALLAQSETPPTLPADPPVTLPEPVEADPPSQEDARENQPSAPVALPAAPTEDQATAAKLVFGLLSDSRYAYRPKPLDDAMSEQILERYLEALDRGKQFFLASDIADFDRYSLLLDDAIRSGGMEPAYDIFAIFRERVADRIEHARGLLHEDIFDFTAEERYHYDREDVPWPATEDELDELWRQIVRNDWLRLELAGKDPDSIRETLDKRYVNLLDNTNELDGRDVFQMFMNAYAGAIDPHTAYFTPRTAENFNLSMSLSLEGIGAVLQKQDDMTAIREIMPGGPADKSGLLGPGDRVVGVGQGTSGPMEDVIGWRLDNVVEKIRGPKGSKVRLDVIPASAGQDSE